MKHIALVLLLMLASSRFASAAETLSNLAVEEQAKLVEVKELKNKGLQLRREGKAQEAIPLAQKALEILREVRGKKHPDTSQLLNMLGVLHQTVGDFATARRCYEQALAIDKEVHGKEAPNTAVSLCNLGTLLEAMGDFRAARQHLEQALSIDKEVHGDKHPSTATALNNLGALLVSMGDYSGARPYLEQALAIRKEIFGEKHPETANSLCNLGTLLLSMGDYAEARRHLEQALAIDEEIHGGRHASTATSLDNLGGLLARMGDYPDARLCSERALAVRKEILGEKHPETARSLQNLGRLLMKMGNYTEARSYLEQALAIRQEVLDKKHLDILRSLQDLGDWFLWRGDFQAAWSYYDQVLTIGTGIRGDNLAETANWLNKAAMILYLMGEYAESRKFYERALAVEMNVFGVKHCSTVATLSNLGRLLRLMGDFAAARWCFQKALAIRKEILGEKHLDIAFSFQGLSELDAASDRWEEAAKNQDQARRIVRRYVTRLLPSLSTMEQVAFLTANDKWCFDKALTLGLLCAAESSLVSLSSGWLLNGKAVAQEAMTQAALLVRQSDDPKIRATVRELLTLRSQLAALTLSEPKSGQEAARRTRLEQMEHREEALTRRIAEANGKDFEADPWIEVAAVRRALPADAVLIDIARFDVFDFQANERAKMRQAARYAAWVTPAADIEETVKILDLGEAGKIDQAVQDVRKALQAAISKNGTISEQGEPEAERLLRVYLEQLSKLVLQRILQEIGDVKQLIVSPDAALWLVPWDALPLEDGRYAIEEYQIRYVVSGRDLVSQQSVGLETNQPVIMANPDFDLSLAETQAATVAVLGEPEVPRGDGLRSFEPMATSSVLPTVRRLPYTAAEAELISPRLQEYAVEEPILYTDQYAREGIFKALERPKVVVLSTHGFFLEEQEIQHDDQMLASTEMRRVALTIDGKPIENPLLRCGLLLAGCNQSSQARSAGVEDGVLTGMEIVGTDFRGTELVVLSACETGLGQVRNGEGVAGLRQAFQLAGAQAVVATLWQVSDRESARLMTTFFENLATGQTKANALRNAQLKMIEYRRNRYGAAHPFLLGCIYVHRADRKRPSLSDGHERMGSGDFGCGKRVRRRTSGWTSTHGPETTFARGGRVAYAIPGRLRFRWEESIRVDHAIGRQENERE